MPDANLIRFYKNNLKQNFNSLFTFTAVDDTVVYKYLLEIKSTATGADKINIHMLLLCCPYILPVITHIINTCLLNGVFPDSWKLSNILPIPKKKSITSLNELRPISILPILSKVIEKIMKFQLCLHINEYDVLPVRQSGFRPGHSCTTALLDVTDDLFRDIDNKKTAALILLDYSKAFDTINHEILLSILHYIGCSA